VALPHRDMRFARPLAQENMPPGRRADDANRRPDPAEPHPGARRGPPAGLGPRDGQGLLRVHDGRPQGGEAAGPGRVHAGLRRRFLEWRRKGFSWSAIYLHAWHVGLRTRDGREWSYGSIRRAVEAETRLEAQEAGQPAAPAVS